MKRSPSHPRTDSRRRCWLCAGDAQVAPLRSRSRERRSLLVSLEVLEVDILWPRWVARIGVTRSTQAWLLTADRQCTELPLLRLPRLVHEFRRSDPMRQTRDLARVGWRGLAARKGGVRGRSPQSAPFLPIGPRVSGLASQIRFSRLGQARGASPGSLDQRSEEWPLCEGQSGAPGVRLVRPPPRGEGNCGVPTGASVRPSRGGEGSKGVGGSGRGGGVSDFVLDRPIGARGLHFTSSRSAATHGHAASWPCTQPVVRSTDSVSPWRPEMHTHARAHTLTHARTHTHTQIEKRI